MGYGRSWRQCVAVALVLLGAVGACVSAPPTGGKLPTLAVKDWYFLKDGKPLYLGGCTFSDCATVDDGAERLRLVRGKANYIRTWLEAWRGETYTPPFQVVNGKADLSQHNPAFFAKLRQMLDESAKQGVVQELTLFNPWGAENHWENYWWNPANNVQGHQVDAKSLYTLGNPCQSLQERWVDAVLATVDASLARNFVIIEVDNELRTGGGAWRQHFVDYVRGKGRYIISTIGDYCRDYDAVGGANQVICRHGGFSGDPDSYYGRAIAGDRAKPVVFNELYVWYRNPREAQRQVLWNIFMAQGMFCVYHWGHGGQVSQPDTLQDVAVLVRFANSIPFQLFTADDSWLRPGDGKAHGLRGPGAYAAYLWGTGSGQVMVTLPQGTYTVRWMDPATGRYTRTERGVRAEGEQAIAGPAYQHDAVLHITRE